MARKNKHSFTKQLQKASSKLIENPIMRSFLLFMALMLVFAISYSLIEGINFFDSIYWTITTSSTVGYGDISPSTIPGKILALVVMISGVGILGYLISSVSNSIIALNLEKMRGLKKTKARNHVVVIGWNTVSKHALKELEGKEHCVVISRKDNALSLLNKKNVEFIRGDSTSSEVMLKAGVSRAKTVILAQKDDADVIMAISKIRKLNSKVSIIARIDDLDLTDVALHAGCDRVVSPSEIGGNLLYSALHEPSVVEWVTEVSTSHSGCDIIDLKIGDHPDLINKSVGGLKQFKNKLLVGLDRDSDGHVEALPSSRTILRESDTLVLVERSKKIHKRSRHRIVSESVNGSDVLFCGWDPVVRSAVNEFVKERKVIVLTESITGAEKEFYENLGVTFVVNPRIDKHSLIKAKVNKVKNVIVAMESDSDVILLSHIIKSLKKEVNLIARIDSQSNYLSAYEAGVDHIVSPSEIGGQLLAKAVKHPSSVQWLMEATTLAMGPKLRQVPLTTKKSLVGKMIKDVTLAKGQKIVGLDKDSNAIIDVLPRPDTVLAKKDTLILLERA